MRKLGCLLVALAALVTAAPVARADDRTDKSREAFAHQVAAACRHAGGSGEECAQFDGRVIASARVAAYETTWVHRALTLQRGLDDNVSMLRELWPHTHNSFNSSVYSPTLTNQDPNQAYSISDQLRMDIRAIEFDLHVLPGRDDVVLCHGSGYAVGPTHVDVGCSIDRPLRDGLAELNTWLRAPTNRNEIVMLYLENQLFDDVAAHNQVVADLQSTIGDLVYRPSSACATLPYATSRAQIRASGKRVLITGNCGPGGWGGWVHERGKPWLESSSPHGDDYPADAACRATRAKVGYASHFIRWYEDSTWVSTMTGGSTSQLTLTDAARMARCGVNLIGFDQLTPEDPRLAAIVWSWAPGEPRAGAGGCASHGPDSRFRARPCSDRLPYACVDAAGGWHITAPCPRGTRFSVPANGYENEMLRAAKATAHAGTVWLAYRDSPSGWKLR